MSTSYWRTCCSSRGGHFRAFGFRHRDEVFDRHGVQHLATETLGGHAGADALACGIHRRCRTGRATADHQHVEGVLGRNLDRVALCSVGVELGDDLLQRHAALVEQFAVQVDGGHRHDLAGFDFFLEQRAVDGDVLDARVEHGGKIQRLHHIRAVLARQREIGFELVVAIQVLHLLDQLGGGLGGVTADLQQCQHQRGELVAHRQAGEAQRDVLAGRCQRKRRLALVVVAVDVQADLVRQQHGSSSRSSMSREPALSSIEALI